MMSRTLWISFSLIALVAAVWLYTLIDSTWAKENGLSIVVTIAFFISAASAVLFAFNAVDAHQHTD